MAASCLHTTPHVISCGRPAAQLVPRLVGEAQSASWQVCVISTPDGRKFLNIALLEKLTGVHVVYDRESYSIDDEGLSAVVVRRLEQITGMSAQA
jgi:cobyric acid synthase